MNKEILELYESSSPSKEELRRLRIEFSSPTFRKKLVKEKGCRCAVCDTTDDVQFHHILALCDGGNNNFANIVPLCHVHHMMVHFHGERRRYKEHANQNLGRGRKVDNIANYEQILEDYLLCRIGKHEAEMLLGLTGECARLNGKPWFKEYLERNGIEKYRNNIDILNSRTNNGVRDGVAVGYIVINGIRTVLYYNRESGITLNTVSERLTS